MPRLLHAVEFGFLLFVEAIVKRQNLGCCYFHIANVVFEPSLHERQPLSQARQVGLVCAELGLVVGAKLGARVYKVFKHGFLLIRQLQTFCNAIDATLLLCGHLGAIDRLGANVLNPCRGAASRLIRGKRVSGAS